ncbi:MAG: hypothetical protein MJZ51_05755 [Bacteroidales bacterium]|nr:hypothetical protein [Bacteroidales bacterium]
MKKVIFASIATMLILASCVRKEDWEMLRSPMHISGEVDPQFGFPVASSELLLEDVIGLIPGADQYIDNSANNGFIQLDFDTNLVTTIDFSSKKAHKRRASKSVTAHGDTIVIDTVFTGIQEINFFDESNDILKKVKLSNMLVNWTADLAMSVSSDFTTLDPDKVKAYISNFNIEAIGLDNTHLLIPLQVDTIDLGALLTNHTLSNVQILPENFDIAALASQIAEMAPQKIAYSGTFTIKTTQSALADPQSIISGDLKIESITINSHIDAKFPLNLSIEYLAHTIDTVGFSMGDKLDSIISNFENQGLTLDMKEAEVKLRVDNSLPFDVKLGAVVLDESQQAILTILDTNSSSALAGAPIAPSAENPSLYVTTGSARSNVSVGITHDQLQTLKRAKYVRFIVALATSRDNGGNHPFVAPRTTDGIKIKMYIKLHPGVGIDIPLSIGNANNN